MAPVKRELFFVSPGEMKETNEICRIGEHRSICDGKVKSMNKRQQRDVDQQPSGKPGKSGSSKPGQQLIRSLGEKARVLQVTNPLRSVGLKLFLSFFLSIVILVLAVGLISYSTASTIIQDKVSTSSQEAITQASGKLDILLEQYEQKTLDFLVDPQLVTYMRAIMDTSLDDIERFEAQRGLQDIINKTAVADNNIKAIHLALVNGMILTSSTASASELNAIDTEWYDQAMEKNGQEAWFSTVPGGLFDTSNNAHSFGVARKVSDLSTGHAFGVVLVELHYSVLERALSDLINEQMNNHIAIVDDNGHYVFNNASDLLATKSTVELLEDAETGLDQNGVESLIAHSAISSTGWRLIGTYPVESLVADARTILWTTFWSTLAAGALAVLLSLIMVRMISKPLGTLRRLMKEGEQGNLLVRTNFKNRDEFGELGISFNQMMEKITQLVKQTNESAQLVLDQANELLEASRKTALSAKEISVATEEIANGATTLATEAEKGSDLTTHIGQQMKNAVDANLQMGASAQEVRAVSEQGITYMNELTMKTAQTEEKTRLMVEKVDRLKESTSSIRQILEVLNAVTKQTNILSLNATIEAARAGAAGKGFMVVADEIRKLADQSRQSIDVVAQITDTIQTEIDETVSVLTEAYPLFQEQITSVKETDKIFQDVQQKMVMFISQLDEVTESIQQLEQSQNTLAEAITNVSAVSQQSSATSEEVASLSSEQLDVSQGLVSLAERLEKVSTDLKETLSKFKV